MTISYKGELSLGQVVPMALQAAGILNASLGAQLPDVQARLDGLLAVSVAPPPSIADLIASVQQMLAALQTLLSAPLPDISATASAIADLQATLGQLQAGLSFAGLLNGLLGSPGIYAYTFDGKANQVAGELGSEVGGGLPGGSGGSETIAGTILFARDGGAIDALRTVLLA